MGFLSSLAKGFEKNQIDKYFKRVDLINALEKEISALSNEELRNKTTEFQHRLQEGETEDDILTEAFAVVREAAKRTVGMRPFDVQLLGGIVLHEGNIAEMKTGEGKTLVATLPAYLNALSGKGVHIVTVNDYLASRDSQWMGQIYRFLGLEVGLIIHGLTTEERKQAYQADITYATNNELGFDYLKDNMVINQHEIVQRKLHYAIVDEVDSILIDEARTPLIISGSGKKSTNLYKTADAFVKTLKAETDYTLEEKDEAVSLTETGTSRAERYFRIDNLSDVDNMEILHHINQALRAHKLKHRDKDYIVQDDEIIIVDEFTGRLMHGRRYSEGLHQAIEAKERVTVARESVTMATITFQNYFRLYNKLAGMTGTAKTEEEEFSSIYNMNVITIPTNKPMIRQDMEDIIYKNEKVKFDAVIDEIAARHQTGQPVLVGTISIEKSETLSRLLSKKGIKHNVLNAKQHDKEAEIITHAGQRGAVTISTNMAGRGTDIVLGEGVLELGGLHIIGTERHESRRIDNQLRGRAGRQGDVGSSQFFISIEDDLMRIFAGERFETIADKLPDDMPIEHRFITKGIESAQKRVETRNFGIRKNVLQFDNVLNKQREVIYAQRRIVFEKDDISEEIQEMLTDLVSQYCESYTSVSEFYEEWDLKGLITQFEHFYLPRGSVKEEDLPHTREEIEAFFQDKTLQAYHEQEKLLTPEIMRKLERDILLRVVDMQWMEHLDNMDQLRQGVGLQAYGNINPIQAYTKEGFDMFEEMSHSIQEDTIRYLLTVRLERTEPAEKRPVTKREDIHTGGKDTARPQASNKNKVGRNDPCPCGSGKKYKRCCGA